MPNPLFGALKTVTGGVVHVASGGWLCRVCGKPVQQYLEQGRCNDCIRKGRR